MNIQNFLKKFPVGNNQLFQISVNSPFSPSKCPDIKTNQVLQNNFELNHTFGIQYNQPINLIITKNSDHKIHQVSKSPLKFTKNQNFKQSRSKLLTQNNSLQDEFNEIQKLKQVYQNKVQNQIKSSKRSIEKSSGRSTSNQKHSLKPSINPNRNEQGNLTQIQRRACQNRLKMYYEQAKRFSQRKQINSIKKCEQNCQSKQKKYILMLEESIKEKSNDVEEKDKKIFEIQNQNEQLKSKFKEVIKENLLLRDNYEKLCIEKQNIENLLKQILYERQKSKLILKEETNQKSFNNQQQTPSKSINMRSNEIKKSTSKDKQNNNMMNLGQNIKIKTKQNKNTKKNENYIQRQQKKLKVQNILDKLKIKISR